MTLDALLTLLGRTHPLLVHFPIALLVVAGLLSLLRAKAPPSDTLVLLVRIGAAGAVLAAGSGWLFAAQDPPARGLRELLLWHRWAGVGTAVIAMLAAVGVARAHRAGRGGAVLPLLAVLAGVSWTAHLGGSMVYGEGFFTEPLRSPSEAAEDGAGTGNSAESESAGVSSSTPDPEPQEDVAAASAQVTFQADVLPIFSRHCFECHGPTGPAKAGLRLADEEALFEDVPELWVVYPGDPDGSPLVQLVELPPDDEDHMPKKGEPLSPEELATLRAWVSALER